MSDAVVEALTLDLLEWLASGERTYEETMDAWRTSCPKLPIWEDANDRGFITRENANGREIVRITSLGIARLERGRQIHQCRPAPTDSHWEKNRFAVRVEMRRT